MEKEKKNLPELDDIRKDLDALTDRLTKVESLLEQLKGQEVVPGKRELPEEEAIDIKFSFQSKGSIEYGVGEYGMAWIGNIVLFFGLIFLVSYLQNTVSSLISSATAFTAVALVYITSYYTRHSLSVLSKLLVFNGHFLLYFFTLRLHFFQEVPLIQNKILGFVLPVVVSAAILYIAIRKKSQFTAGLSMLMLIAAGVFYDVIGVV